MDDAQCSMIAASFGKVLRRRRKEAGLSQESMAEIAEVQRNYISSLERGIYQPTISVVLGLAKALNCTAADLVSEVERTLSGNSEE